MSVHFINVLVMKYGYLYKKNIGLIQFVHVDTDISTPPRVCH